MADSLQLNSQQDMTNLQNGCARSSVEHSPPIVTTAEVSSEQSTKAESPQQPQAVTMAAASSTASLSTVHVQTLPSYNSLSSIPVLTHSVSEPIHNLRRTLTRSAAVSSPPPPDEQPEPLQGTQTMNVSIDSSDSGFAGELPPRLEALARSQGHGSLSRDSSFEYTDSTGTDLVGFIIKTMKNPRDRKFLARLEQDCLLFIQDQTRLFIQYPQMTSYHRMIVHRVAAYFGMDHNVDQQTGKSVIINKTTNTRIPEQRFSDLVNREEGEEFDGLAPRSILRRQNTPSGDEGTPPKVDSPGVHHTMDDKRSKSIEEREERYNKVRDRIFNQDSTSSQSSQSSKGDGDPQQPQILLREDFTAEELCPEAQPTNSRLCKSKSLDSDRGPDRQVFSSSGIKIMTTKSLTRSSSSPGHGASVFYDRSLVQCRGGGNNSPRGSRHYPSSTPSMAPATYPFWSSEGLPSASSLPSGEVPMVPVQSMAPSMPGMVMTSQAGGLMWAIPQESMQHGMMLINPNTGTPVLGNDGAALIVQPAYQPAMVKPGQGTSYIHQGHQQAQQPQVPQPHPTQQQQGSLSQQQGSLGQQQGLPPGQMMMSQQYVGMQQPVYVVPQPGRPQFAPQQTATEAMQGGQWMEAAQTVPPNNPSYQDMTAQFATMSIPMPQTDMEGGVQQQYSNSGVSASTTTSGPMYVSSVNQGGGAPRAFQYMMYPSHPAQVPMQQVRPVMHNQPVTSHLVAATQQQVQQGSSPQQPAQAYVYGTGAPFQQMYYHQQYAATGKDASAVQYAHSQTPSTPPRASSPSLSALPYNQQQIYSSPPSQQASVQYPPQTHTPPYQQQSPSRPPSQVLRSVVPVMVPAPCTVAMATPRVPLSAVQYQPGAVQVQAQYPANQKMAYNVDRQQPKMSDVYGHDGAFVQVVPVGYGDTAAMAQGEIGQYSPYVQPSRFASQGHMTSTSGAQYQPPSRQKQKSHRDRRGQSPRGGQHQEQGRKQMGSRSHSTETEKTTGGGHILEVYDLPSGIKGYETESLLEDLKKAGGKIRGRNTHSSDDPDDTAVVHVAFSTRTAAEQALNTITNPKFKLRLPSTSVGSCSHVDGHSVVASSS